AQGRRPDLRERLLGREAGGQARVGVAPPGQLGELVGVEAALEEAVGVVLGGASHAGDLDQVEAHGHDHASLPRRRTPPWPATNARSAMPRKSPCSTTPGSADSSAASSAGSKRPAKRRSTTRLPLSVTTGAPSRSRTTASPPSAPSRRTVRASPKRTT